MASRAFTVFQDVPASSEASTSAPRVARAPSGVLARSGFKVNVTSSVDANAVTDKENYNPLTGERASLAGTAEKKRKTAVLATKLHVVASATSKKEKAGQPEPKKRKTISSSKKTKSTTAKKDTAKSSTSTRKAKRSSPSRRVSPMPKVVEETGVEVETQRTDLSQEAIDSRCYELTVKPLADVSDAYEVSTSSIELATGESKGPFRMIKEPSVEPELRDYFSPPPASLGSSQLERFIEEESKATHVFSTPERKKIYSAFTFSSPSPSSKRFRDFMSRSGSPTPSTGRLSPVSAKPVDHDS